MFMILEYCLDVIVMILIRHCGGAKLRTRFMWTCAVSKDAQYLIYTLNWCITKPSFSKFFLNKAACFWSFFSLPGKSNITNIHMIWYAFSLSILIALTAD